ncbi:aminotransferase class III-fold pyridoxal phosphate-dependent enzyme, partial [Candidatus Parcubacteria bacterium]|nr:aminotransferase class III-fold pyridoxal phosphate-dependent enzyme [Candidatus Parcubacteria bacterium]
MKNLCIIQARMGATRLPGKVLKKVNNITLLEYEINRIKRAEKINKIVVATSNKPADDAIEKECARLGINCFRGSENDVLDRYWQCALKYYDYDNIIRATGDCTLIDPVIIDKVINLFEKNNLDYASNVLKETFPDGMDVEIFKRTVLEDAVNNAKLPSEREHVTQCIIKNKKFKKGNLSSRYNFGHFRLTVDEPRDFEVIKFLIENCKPDASYLDYISILTKNPEVMLKNMNITRNEGLLKSLKNDFVVKNKFNESNEMLSKVNKVIPLASQTFSKSYLQYIKGQAPLFVTHAKGCRIWDVDGNEYIDFINGLLPVVLGYQYPAVDNAIKEQLEKGIIFSLPSTLEYELAQILIKHIPCAEMVRFGKNGSDATSGAVRLARAITGRD